MNVGITSYSVVLGKNNRTVEEIIKDCGEKATAMRDIGLDNIPTENETLLEDMILDAIKMINKNPDLIIIAHSIPFIFTNWKKFIEKMSPVETISISGMPCVVMHAAIRIACKYIENKVYDDILVVGADKAYSDEERCFFNTIMGDGVVAILLGQKDIGSKIIYSNVQTSIIAANGENSDESDIAEFRASNAMFMRKAIEEAVDAANICIDDIDFYIPHTSNKTFWDLISKLMHIDRDKFLDGNMRNTGHMNSHDSFYHFLRLKEDGVIKKGENVLLVNPGFGGSQGCTLIIV